MAKLRTGAVVGALALVAAACGGSDGPDATSAGTQATVAVTTTSVATGVVTTEASTTLVETTSVATSGLPPTTLPPTTAAPTTAAPTTAVPTTPDAAAIELPAGAVVTSMSWPATDVGWAIAEHDDGTRALLHTTDAGATWTTAPIDATPLQSVVFADEQDGWIAGDDGLRSTHDGGTTWTLVSIGSGVDAAPAVAAAGGLVHVAYLGAGVAGIGIATSPVDHDAFVPASLVVPFGAGPVMDVTMTAGGPYAALVYNDRTLAGGAEIRSGAWASWDLPCPDAGAPIGLAGLSPQGQALTLACSPSGFGDPAAVVAADLSSGTVHWVEIEPAADPSVGMARIDLVAATDAGVRLVVYTAAGTTDDTIVASTDGGATWPTRVPVPSGTGAATLAHLPDGSLLLSTWPSGGLASADGLTWAAVGTTTAVS